MITFSTVASNSERIEEHVLKQDCVQNKKGSVEPLEGAWCHDLLQKCSKTTMNAPFYTAICTFQFMKKKLFWCCELFKQLKWQWLIESLISGCGWTFHEPAFSKAEWVCGDSLTICLSSRKVCLLIKKKKKKKKEETTENPQPGVGSSISHAHIRNSRITPHQHWASICCWQGPH